MARGKGTSVPRDDRQKSNQARESRPKEQDEQQGGEQPQDQNPNEEWWRNDGGGQGEVY